MWSTFKFIAVPALRAAHAAAGELLAEDARPTERITSQAPGTDSRTRAEECLQDVCAAHEGNRRSHAHDDNLRPAAQQSKERDSAAEEVHYRPHVDDDSSHVVIHQLNEQPLPGSWISTPPRINSPVHAQDQNVASRNIQFLHYQTTGDAGEQDVDVSPRQATDLAGGMERSAGPKEQSENVDGDSQFHEVGEERAFHGLPVKGMSARKMGKMPVREGTLNSTAIQQNSYLMELQSRPDEPRPGTEGDGGAFQATALPGSSRAVSIISISSSTCSSSAEGTSQQSDSPGLNSEHSQSSPPAEGTEANETSPISTCQEFVLKKYLPDDESNDTGLSIPATMPQKRRRSPSSPVPSPLDYPSSSDEDDTTVIPKINSPRIGPSKKRTKSAPESLYVAKVEETATRVASSTSDLADSTIIKIQRMLSRADGTANEHEARTALKRATEQMTMLNITRAEVLSHSAGKAAHAGHSVVSIRRRDGNTQRIVRFSAWNYDLANAIKLFFGTKHYTSQAEDIEFHFYGIAENTVASAHAFELVFNDISRWALDYKGMPARNSYCLGICETLRNDALRERREEERTAEAAEQREMARRIREEEEHRQAELDRLLAPLPNDEAEASDREADSPAAQNDIAQNLDRDLDDEEDDIKTEDCDHHVVMSLLGAVTSSTPAPLAQNATAQPEAAAGPQWKSKMQVDIFRKNAQQLADDYLKTILTTKLRSARKSKAKTFDQVAYNKGREDGKNIDVRRKTIKDSNV